MMGFVAENMKIDGKIKYRGDPLTLEEINSHEDERTPHISVLAKLRKFNLKRIAPDGR